MRSLMLLVLSSLVFADNAELKQIYDKDQEDRSESIGKIDWDKVSPRDAARRKRVSELLESNLLVTGRDYERAALVFQHGDEPDDYLLAHVLAVTALGKGVSGAPWLAAATLDRYLHKVDQPQVFGTQYDYKVENGKQLPWTMEPYSRSLVSPALRKANCVIDLDDQELALRAIAKGEDPKPPKRPPCPEPSQSK